MASKIIIFLIYDFAMEVAACNAAENETGRNSVLTLVRTMSRSVCKQQDSAIM